MRGNYRVLQQRRADLLRESGALLDAPLTDEGRARHDAIKAEVAQINADLARYEAQFEAERQASAVSSIQVTDRGEQDPMRGFATAADFARSVRAACIPGGRVDQRLMALSQIGAAAPSSPYHEEGHSQEGYMVPPAVRDGIWDIAFEPTDLQGLVFVEDTERNAVNWVRDESTPWGATGIQAKWRAEASAMTPSRLVTDPSQLRIHELYAFASATEEELEDAPLTSSRLVRGAGRAIQWKASDAIMRGTGAGQPLGWLNAPCLITQAAEGGQTADTIVAKNVLKMYARMLDNPGSNWLWVMTRDSVPQLVDLKIGNEPAWQAQNQGLQQAPSGMLLGVPIRFSRHCSALGDVGDISLIDLNGYYLLRRAGGVRFATSIHLYFDFNASAFRWTFRLGGQPFLSAAVTQPNSQSSQSSFITLAAR